MKNKKGFTLVELMIVIGIAAILAVISIPSVMKWYKKDQFIQQTREIIDMINDARTNAITEKKCSNGKRSVEWSFYTQGRNIKLFCMYDSGGTILRFTEKDILLDDSIDYNSDFIFYTKDGINYLQHSKNGRNHIIFSSTGRSSAIYLDNPPPIPPGLNPNTKYDVKKIQIPLKFTEDESIKRTICFDRIAGFPTMSLTEECDD